ncbi:unnamed protein product [Callosobruchus maculatus]|uniref:BBSome complex member BBS5 PH domain-containing protein n=1 Tax=Callosobruchus maculatus TaxID=64391 RepID=A0A653D8N2_CALMS|nr:unnamed protein product [Callosobruchus maculatus]
MSLKWEDKEVRFDIPYSEMRLILGEKVIDKLEHIEDTKGNSAIGFGCIISTNTKTVNSKLKGTAQALQLLTTSKGTRYEFIFTNLVPGNTRHFTSVVGVHKAYNSSKLYRELKLRGAVVQHKQLKILPQEQVFSTMHGVFNLSSDQGSLGTFIVTNVRFVWFADMNEGFNISLPYLQIDNICIRESKFGIALVITSTESSGGFILGFKVDPEDKMKTLYKELTSLHTIYSTKPIFGVEYKWCSNKNLPEQNNNLVEDFDALEDTKNEIGNTIAAYLADEGHKDRPPVYSNELGLAVETLKEGYTLQKLWEVIPS